MSFLAKVVSSENVNRKTFLENPPLTVKSKLNQFKSKKYRH
jgi:hypothetical protein